jgi:methylthioribose-1-phosphate isomerase
MLKPVEYNSLRDLVELIDQTRLPERKVTIDCKTHQDIARAIKGMQVRGAPAIGIAAAFGFVLGLKEFTGQEPVFPSHITSIAQTLAETRPTAVNLFWALDRVKRAAINAWKKAEPGRKIEQAIAKALAEAKALLQEDIDMCRQIGHHGAEYLANGSTWLTHCNAGALATGAYGTALGVFRAAKEQGKQFSVFVDETRPLLQGARLTAWEMVEENIPATLICDNMAGSLMAAGRIQGVVVGADRITADGFTANKIGTYSVAVLAHYHKIPFYVAAPVSTFDLSIHLGSEIPIEERHPDEVRFWGSVLTAPREIKVFNPAFDVTPPELITAIFTNRGVLLPDFKTSIARQIKV